MNFEQVVLPAFFTPISARLQQVSLLFYEHDPMISIQELAKTYGFGTKKIEAVRGIDFEIPRVEIFGLVGSDDFHCFQPGGVLIAHTMTTVWTQLFNLASAALAEVGGLSPMRPSWLASSAFH